MFEVIGGLSLIGLVAYIWFSMPPESEEIVEARKHYGKAK